VKAKRLGGCSRQHKKRETCLGVGMVVISVSPFPNKFETFLVLT